VGCRRSDQREDMSIMIARLLRASRDLSATDPQRSGLLRRAAEHMMQVEARHMAKRCRGTLH
jgi:hypothetical protein